jgi:uncharacterized protein (DUF58 family)
MVPTRRVWILLLIAAILYLLANQTQVGWIYVISAAIFGLVGVTGLYGWGNLRGVAAERSFARPAASAVEAALAAGLNDLTGPTFHEDDEIEVSLSFSNRARRPAFLLSGVESCPFAPPADQAQPFFIPAVFKNQPLKLRYRTQAERRGLFLFPAVSLGSAGPVGLFRGNRSLIIPGDLLIYPAYQPLKRLRILERHEAGRWPTTQVGSGEQIIGSRDYRPGDSLRQVHWRSTARRGALVVKEFSNDDRLSLTVVLDLQSPAKADPGKFAPFETAVRVAASLAYYARQQEIPFYLAGANPAWRPGQAPLSWWAALNHLAKVQNNGHIGLGQVLAQLPPLPFIVVLLSQPTAETAMVLAGLQQRQNQLLAIAITPDGTLPAAAQVSQTARLKTKVVRASGWRELVAEL